MTKITLAEGGHSGWHTHPGLTIVIVTEGKVRLTRFTEEDGCIAQVFGPDELEQGFVEVANEVHIAENVGEGPGVLQAIRLNFPVGGDITDFGPEDPGCNVTSGSQSGNPSSRAGDNPSLRGNQVGIAYPSSKNSQGLQASASWVQRDEAAEMLYDELSKSFVDIAYPSSQTMEAFRDPS